MPTLAVVRPSACQTFQPDTGWKQRLKANPKRSAWLELEQIVTKANERFYSSFLVVFCSVFDCKTKMEKKNFVRLSVAWRCSFWNGLEPLECECLEAQMAQWFWLLWRLWNGLRFHKLFETFVVASVFSISKDNEKISPETRSSDMFFLSLVFFSVGSLWGIMEDSSFNVCL